MSHKKDQSELDPEFIQKLIEENDHLKNENKNLMAKVGDLAIRNDFLKDAVESAQKELRPVSANPMPEETLKLVPVRKRAKTPPIRAVKTSAMTTKDHFKEPNTKYKTKKIAMTFDGITIPLRGGLKRSFP